jgi:hypothetical protein
MHAYYYRNSKTPGLVLAGIGFLALLSFGDPLGHLVDQVRANIQLWREETQTTSEKDITAAFKWILENTPTDSIAILPPWRADGWYISQRAQIANYCHFPYDHRCDEWLERVQTLVGEIDSDTTHEDFEIHYNGLAETEITAIVEKYGGEYLVSKGEYSYPMLFDSGTYKVYLLTAR